ncbi:STAS domain-containing protein [Actinocorallia populi]|uniref:STAS domain-containing protein n=1 Tax=Actinocorallia populi TaxID=2079200 RepID=UPI000D0912BA|nr:STAS domain-containing protein [Actinocorallia populi]
MVGAGERLRLEHRVEGEVTVVRPSGEVDVFTAPALREFLLELLEGGMRRLVVDLSGVSFLDSTGLAVLVGIWQRLRYHEGSFALAGANPHITQVLHTTRLDQPLRLHGTVDEAVAAG